MSTGNTVRSTLGAVDGDRVRALQHVLYRAAKADPGRRFHALFDKICRTDVLQRAWVQVRRNNGAPGIDGVSIAEVEEYGVGRLLGELAAALADGSYRPLPARRVYIPKPGSAGERRPLSVPAVSDRIVQAAARIVLEPVFEAGFLPCSFGFRPGLDPRDALQVLIDESWRGRRWVVETDIKDCFGQIPKDQLMQAVEERVSDRRVLKLLRAMLGAGVMEDGRVEHPLTGTAQGSVISPLLCNIYLHRIDRAWSARAHGVLVRFADDAAIMCKDRRQAEAALARYVALLAGLGLEPKAAKTRIVHLTADAEDGADFLGFHHRLVTVTSRRTGRKFAFLARWPRNEKMQYARDRIREITSRPRLRLPIGQIVTEMNAFLRGFAGYFRFGNSARALEKLQWYAFERLAKFVAERHKRSWAFGRWVVGIASPDRLGLLCLDGIIVAPRHDKPWRDTPNAGGEERR